MAGVLAALVEGPIGFEVSTRPEGAESQDSLGTVEAPAGAGDVHAVLDEIPARPFDDAGGDGQAGGQRDVVVEVLAVLDQVIGAIVGGAPRALIETTGSVRRTV
jgi:hypothetical protein